MHLYRTQRNRGRRSTTSAWASTLARAQAGLLCCTLLRALNRRGCFSRRLL